MNRDVRKQWQEELETVQRITDSLGEHVDSKIEETVVALHLLGFPTVGSCEGHLDHGLPYPWIDVDVAHPMSKNIKDETECKMKNSTLEGQLQEHLKTFYASRTTPADVRLTMLPYGLFGAFRLQSVASDMSVNHLTRYQNEMIAFANFLKNLFYGHH